MLSIPSTADLRDLTAPPLEALAASSRRKARKAGRKAMRTRAARATVAFADEAAWRANAIGDAAAGKRRRRAPAVVVALGLGATAGAVYWRFRSSTPEPAKPAVPQSV
jgi:hypothetical protein